MKTKTIITELNQEDLVVLLSTATYGSNWLDSFANDRKGVQVEDGDCIEEIQAKCLLAGKRITFVDYYAEGEHHGELPYTFGKEEEECEYSVSLDDIVAGLQKCADGSFKNNGDHEVSWLKDCFAHFAEGGFDLDLTEAEALMQVVIFGELIYG